MKIRNAIAGALHLSSGQPPSAAATAAAHGRIDQPSRNVKKKKSPAPGWQRRRLTERAPARHAAYRAAGAHRAEPTEKTQRSAAPGSRANNRSPGSIWTPGFAASASTTRLPRPGTARPARLPIAAGRRPLPKPRFCRAPLDYPASRAAAAGLVPFPCLDVTAGRLRGAGAARLSFSRCINGCVAIKWSPCSCGSISGAQTWLRGAKQTRCPPSLNWRFIPKCPTATANSHGPSFQELLTRLDWRHESEQLSRLATNWPIAALWRVGSRGHISCPFCRDGPTCRDHVLCVANPKLFSRKPLRAHSRWAAWHLYFSPPLLCVTADMCTRVDGNSDKMPRPL